MKPILGIFFIVGIIILCAWLKFKSNHNTYLNQLLEPEKNPPDNKKMLARIIKKARKDRERR